MPIKELVTSIHFAKERVHVNVVYRVFRNPYPRTTFVPVPLGDPTTLELCRNLPLALFEGEEMPKPIQPASAPGMS